MSVTLRQIRRDLDEPNPLYRVEIAYPHGAETTDVFVVYWRRSDLEALREALDEALVCPLCGGNDQTGARHERWCDAP